MIDYMTPLEGEPVGGETVRVVSEKWPDPIEQDWSYQAARVVGVVEKEPPVPWEEHRTQGREALRTELKQLATGSFRAVKWAEIQTDLPDGLLTDIRAIAEKLRQTVQTLS